MKSFLMTLGVLVCFVFSPVYGQLTDEEAKLFQDAWGLDKKDMIADYMELSEENSESFWQVYDSYMVERKDLGMERYQIVKEYAENYEGLTGEKADELMQRVFKNNLELEKLQQKCYKKMKKAVGPLEASRFIQAEKYIEAVIRAEFLSSIPFIGEFEEMRN